MLYEEALAKLLWLQFILQLFYNIFKAERLDRRVHSAKLCQGRFKVFFLNGLQQIINAVDLECTKRIFVVRSGKDHGALHFGKIEYLKALPVRQFNVHENKVWLRVHAQPV